MRKHTGLRNKYRSGRSTYSIRNKRVKADKYGNYNSGHLTTSENIAGRSISRQLPAMETA